MKIGYLVLAHNNPGHFERLIHALIAEENRIFVHMDLKSDLSQYKQKFPGGHVHFVKNRVAVGWGGYTIVEAILNMLTEALEGRDYCDYYILLSGSDYPIRSQAYIHDFLSQRYGREFMNIVAASKKPVSKHMARVCVYYCDYAQLLHPLVPDIIPRISARVINRLKIPRDCGAFLKKRRLYGGSLWWALTLPAVRHILDYAAANPELESFYRYSCIPDESFFQTILGNSGFQRNMSKNVTYADWSYTGKHQPAIITREHIAMMKLPGGIVADDFFGERDLLFARKFPDDSEELVKEIQRDVW